MGTAIPGLVSDVVEQATKAPAPGTEPPTPVPSPTEPAPSSPSPGKPRQPLSLSLPTGSSLSGPQGAKSLDPMQILHGGSKGAK